MKANAKAVLLLQYLAGWNTTCLLDVSLLTCLLCEKYSFIVSVKYRPPYCSSEWAEVVVQSKCGGDKFHNAVKILSSPQ